MGPMSLMHDITLWHYLWHYYVWYYLPLSPPALSLCLISCYFACGFFILFHCDGLLARSWQAWPRFFPSWPVVQLQHEDNWVELFLTQKSEPMWIDVGRSYVVTPIFLFGILYVFYSYVLLPLLFNFLFLCFWFTREGKKKSHAEFARANSPPPLLPSKCEQDCGLKGTLNVRRKVHLQIFLFPQCWNQKYCISNKSKPKEIAGVNRQFKSHQHSGRSHFGTVCCSNLLKVSVISFSCL